MGLIRKLSFILTLAILVSCGTAVDEEVASIEAKSVSDEATPSSSLDTYVVGIVPQQSASKLAKLWIPVLNHVGKQAGVRLQFETAKSIPEFEKRCADGLYDIAYMNPYHYTVFHESPGYEAIAKQAKKQIQGIIVKRKDNPMTTLEDLANETLAFPAPRAFAATLLTRAALDAKSVPYAPKFVSSHDSVYRGVAKGLFPAGGGIVRTFKGIEPDIQDQLEIFWKTPTYTPHAFAIHPRVSSEAKTAIVTHILALDDTETGRNLIAPLNFKGIDAASDNEWDDVRALNITLE